MLTLRVTQDDDCNRCVTASPSLRLVQRCLGVEYDLDSERDVVDVLYRSMPKRPPRAHAIEWVRRRILIVRRSEW